MAGKAVPSTKKMTKRKVAAGDSLQCEVCGLSVVVEEIGGVAIAEETVLLCCGKPMKPRASKPKSSKK